MTRRSVVDNQFRVKIELAAKWERRARSTSSKPARARFFRRADRYRHQAAALRPGSMT